MNTFYSFSGDFRLRCEGVDMSTHFTERVKLDFSLPAAAPPGPLASRGGGGVGGAAAVCLTAKHSYSACGCGFIELNG